MVTRRPCIIGGCATSTVYEDGKCRAHRRIQKTMIDAPVTRLRMSQVAESLSGTEESKNWANQLIGYGQYVMSLRPQVRELGDSWLVSNWDIAPYDNNPNPLGSESYVTDDVATGNRTLVVSKSGASREQVEQVARERYRSSTFLKTGGNSSSVEQYDDAAEAIVALNIGSQYGDTRLAYMMKPSGEAVRLTSVTPNGEKCNISVDIVSGDFEPNSDGVCYRSYNGVVKEVMFDGKEIDRENVPDQAKLLIQEICKTRELIGHYSFQDQGHEGTQGFFIPAGWTGMQLRG